MRIRYRRDENKTQSHPFPWHPGPAQALQGMTPENLTLQIKRKQALCIEWGSNIKIKEGQSYNEGMPALQNL